MPRRKTKDSEALRAAGWMDAREFLDALVKGCRTRREFLRGVLSGSQFTKVKPILLYQEHIVNPSDWKPRDVMYSPDILPLVGGFVRRHRLATDTQTRRKLGIKCTMVDAVDYLKAFQAGEQWALDLVPAGLLDGDDAVVIPLKRAG